MPPLVAFSNPPLSRRVAEVRYQHVQDGRWYKHAFKRGVRADLRSDGSVLLRHEDGRSLWGDFPNEDGDMRFLDNPRRRRRRKLPARGKGGRFLKTRRTARRRVRRAHKQTLAAGGSMATRRRRRRRHAVAAPRRRRRRRHPVRVVHYSANPRRRRRRSHVRHARRRYRRNPALFGGLMGANKQGAKDGALVVVGQAAQNAASGLVGRFVPLGGFAGAAVAQVGSAVVVTVAARKIWPAGARMLAAGAWARAIKGLLSAVSPTAAGLLGDGEVIGLPDGAGLMESQGSIGAWPGAQMGAWPGAGLGDAADEHVVYS